MPFVDAPLQEPYLLPVQHYKEYVNAWDQKISITAVQFQMDTSRQSQEH